MKETRQISRVSVERVVSGPGLVNVYEFLSKTFPDRVDKDVDAGRILYGKGLSPPYFACVGVMRKGADSPDPLHLHIPTASLFSFACWSLEVVAVPGMRTRSFPGVRLPRRCRHSFRSCVVRFLVSWTFGQKSRLLEIRKARSSPNGPPRDLSAVRCFPCFASRVPFLLTVSMMRTRSRELSISRLHWQRVKCQ